MWGFASGTKENQEIIAEKSRQRSKEIEAALFESSSRKRADGFAFILITRDIKSNLLYAPVTNLKYLDLERALGTTTDQLTLLSVLRNSMVPRPNKERVGGNELLIAQLTREGDGAARRSHLFSLNQDGHLESDLIHWDGKQEPEIDTSEFLPLDPNALSFLSTFTEISGIDGKMFLYLRKGFQNITISLNREFALFQTGFLILKQGLTISPHIKQELANKAATSEFAALAVLSERERYYEKAARQAVIGDIVKLDSRSAVKKEVDALDELATKERHHVPQLVESDPDLVSGLSDKAWYRMRKFRLPTLLDLLTSVKGFDRFELRRIVASCLDHLEGTYWRDQGRHTVPRKYHIFTLLSFAHSRIDETLQAYRRRTEEVSKQQPVKIGESVNFYDPMLPDQVEAILNIAPDQEFDIVVNWEGERQKFSETTHCRHPVRCLENLWSAFSEIAADTQFSIAKVEGVHGDSHFANIMVDASIPEDPLVVSIDQGSEPFSDAQQERIRLWLKEGGQDYAKLVDDSKTALGLSFFHEGVSLQYDFGKLMMSSACIYSIAYRKGTSVLFDDTEGGVVFRVQSSSQVEATELDESGGISGARIFKVDAPVPSDAWDYHRNAAELIGERFVGYLKEQPEMTKQDVALSVVSLWLLTVRHSFSIAESLFPRNVAASLTMFLMATRLLNKGTEDAVEVLTNPEADYSKLLESFNTHPEDHPE